MDKSADKNSETLFTLLVSAFAFFLLKSIFDNDESKIVTKRGFEILSDSDKMKEINKKLEKRKEISKNKSSNKEILI